MRTHKRISILTGLILLFLSAKSQSWQSLGPSDFNEPTLNYYSRASIACDAAGHLFVAYRHAFDGGGRVRMYNGTTWEWVSDPGIPLAYTSDYFIMMDAAGIPTLVYQERSGSKAAVKKFIGGSWVKYGTGDVSAGTASSIAAANDASGKLYCAYADGAQSGKLMVSYCDNGASWSSLASLSTGAATAVSMAIDGYVLSNEGSGYAYVAYADGANGNALSVKRFNSSTSEFVGSPILSTGSVNITSIALDATGVPYVAFADGANGRKIAVKKFNGAGWDDVGTPHLSIGEAQHIKLVIDVSGNMYVVYGDWGNDGSTMVKRFDGTNWVDAGTGTLTGIDPDLAMDAVGTPYVFYKDFGFGGKAVVKKLTAGAWTIVGGQGVTAQPVRTLKMAAGSSGAPYIIYADYYNNWNATVKKYDGASWLPVGSGVLTTNGADNTIIAMGPNDVPYVFYIDDNDATVKKFDGSNWVNVGTPGFYSTGMEYVSIAVNSSGIPYIAFKSTVSSKINVWKFDNGSWGSVGAADFSAGAVNKSQLAFDASGAPYVIYSDAGNGNKAMVKSYDGSNWIDIGAGISAGSANHVRLAIDGNNTLYASYYDSEVHVKKFDGGSWAEVGAPASGPSTTTAFGVDGNNVPYIAYNYAPGYELVVKKFDAGNWATVGTAPISAGRNEDELSLAFGINNVPILAYMSGGAYVKSAAPLVILPLQLTSFNGSIINSDALLNWKTESEENTREFLVERSIDGRHYSTAGSVPAANAHGVHQYSYTDRNVDRLGASVIYYRLKQVDRDGKSNYSRVLTLPVAQAGSGVVCYPNPVIGETSITITLSTAEKVQTRLINNTGQVLQVQKWDLSAGSTSLPVNMSQLTKGLYYLEISSRSIKKQIGLVKQ